VPRALQELALPAVATNAIDAPTDAASTRRYVEVVVCRV